MRIGVRKGGIVIMDDVESLVEIPSIFDGWSIAIMKDGTRINRWADPAEPSRPRYGYERRFRATQAILDGEGK